MKQYTAQQILTQTKETYNLIASEFDKTRSSLWPGFDKFLQYIKPHCTVLDAGCGNGRLVDLFQNMDIDYTGLDNNEKLLSLAKKNHPESNFIFGDVLRLPFEDGLFDTVFSIAVLHHIPSKELRNIALSEIHRVLKKRGIFIMTNWDRYTPEYIKYIIQYSFLKILGFSNLDLKDIYVPWGNSKIKRYYHCFTLRELKKLVLNNRFSIIKAYKQVSSQPHFQSNLVIVAQK